MLDVPAQGSFIFTLLYYTILYIIFYIILHYNHARLNDLKAQALPYPIQGYRVDLQMGVGK